jgi:hypothetical protein
MKFYCSMRECASKLLGIMVIAPLLLGLMSSRAASVEAPVSKEPAPAPTATTQPSAEEAAKREDWRATMSRTPTPKKGCFTATYPNTEWQEVPCTTPPNRPYPPARGPRPDIVGNGNDFAAQSSGTISSVVGSFDSVTGVTSVSDPSGQSNFALQLNTNRFTNSKSNVPPCNGAAIPTSCQGWQQFIFSNSGSAFIQHWLINYNNQCPSGWNTYTPPNTTTTDCWVNSQNAASVPVQTIAALAQLSLTGKTAGGTDTIIMSTGSKSYTATGQDSVVNLAPNWQAAEFNVFGDCCSTQANFNKGSTIVVRTSVNDGTSKAPSCPTEGFTGETNNLFLVSPCSSVGGASPAIVFTENWVGGPAAAGNVFASVYNNQQHFPYRDLKNNVQDVWYGTDGWHLQQLTQGPSTLPDEYIVNTPGPAAASDVFSSVYNNQQHFTYRDLKNNVQDVWYGTDGWHLQQLAQGPSTLPDEYIVNTPGPAAASDVFSSVYNNQQHFTYRDLKNNVQDVWYGTDGWHVQQLSQGPSALPGEYIVNTPGPPAASDVFSSVYNNQQHFPYRDLKNNVQDVWYGTDGWHLQQLTQGPSTLPNEYIVNTPGPPAAGNVFASVYNNQQHFTYRDLKNNVQDVWYGTDGWHLQQLTQGPSALPNEYIVNTPGPAAAGDVIASVYNDQQHFPYRDLNNNIRDVWYGTDGWHLQKLAGP